MTILMETYLLDSTSEVLESMCFTSVEQQLPGTSSVATDAGQAAFAIGRCLQFSGKCSGWFGVQTDLETARLIAGNLLGEEGEDLVEEQAGEAIGEIANMICGAMLAKMESKQAFRLSSPEAWPVKQAQGQNTVPPQLPEARECAMSAASPKPMNREQLSAAGAPGAIRCLFQLDCGLMLVWVEVS